MDLKLTYDITQNTFQTVLQAAVLITTSGRPAAKVGASYMKPQPLNPSPLVLSALSLSMPSALQEGAVALNTERRHLLADCSPWVNLHAATVAECCTIGCMLTWNNIGTACQARHCAAVVLVLLPLLELCTKFVTELQTL